MRFLLKGLIFFIVLFGTAIKPCFAQQDMAPPTASIAKSTMKKIVEGLTQTLDKNYLFPEKSPVISNYVKASYKKGAYNQITDPQQLVTQINNDLYQVSSDRHLRIFYSPQRAKQLEMPPVSEHEMKQQRNEELAAARDNNFEFKKVEILPGNVGYVRFDSFFGGDIEEAKPTLNGAFQFLKHSRAIIIDLRFNGGGSPLMACRIQSYFFSQKTHMLNVIEPAQNKIYELYADPAKADSITLNMPVYILTSKNTASGAEGFSYDLQSVKRAILVGETTAGAANMNPAPYNLGHGFFAEIPIARPYNLVTKTNWEVVGVKPDIAVPAEQALTKAHAALLKDFLSKTIGEKEKRKLKFYLNALQASEISATPDSATLRQFVGLYKGGLDFFVKDGRLFCKNAESGNKVVELKPIANNLFVLDDNFQVEFERDGSGVYSKIKLFT